MGTEKWNVGKGSENHVQGLERVSGRESVYSKYTQ